MLMGQGAVQPDNVPADKPTLLLTLKQHSLTTAAGLYRMQNLDPLHVLACQVLYVAAVTPHKAC